MALPRLCAAAALLGAAASAGVAPSPSPYPPTLFNITLLTDAAQQDGAVCLDGSPPAIYVSRGTEAGKFFVHQEGE